MSEELKPCPFCGEEAIYDADSSWGKTTYSIYCTGCGVETLQFKSKKAVRSAWNRRLSDD